MPQYVIAIHHPENFDRSTVDEATHHAIDVLNDEMAAKGVRVYMGGMVPPSQAKTLRAGKDGRVVVTDGPYLETKEYVGGFWIVEAKDMEEALEWGRKGVAACKGDIEVREIGQGPTEE